MNTLIIRADATPEIGTGHVMRCLALAQAWQDKGGQVVFISHCESEALRQRLTAEGFDFVSLDKSHPDPFDWHFTSGILAKLKSRGPKANPWLVVDGYHFDAAYQKSIKAAGYKLLWIDDYGHAEHYYADLILNQNISAEPSCYVNRESYTQLLMGTSYALLRREFERWQGWQREIPAMARKVLVTLGGADPDNVTLKIIQALKQVDIPGLEARIVIGPANPHLELLQREIGVGSKLVLLINVTNMPELMAWADIAVSAGGSTSWELAFMGLPNVITYFAANQLLIAQHMDAAGAAINLGDHQKICGKDFARVFEKILICQELRTKLSRTAQRLVDARGGTRLVEMISMGIIKDQVISMC
jgi:UDP-2,4-diacetamido-2,4,6-trideoxy-beta-L-altropyranose hydrolase